MSVSNVREFMSFPPSKYSFANVVPCRRDRFAFLRLRYFVLCGFIHG